MLADEWAELGWNNVAQMQSFGMPGVFTHGDFDTWSPGYLMFLAAMHNGISRLYETFGNGGADTEKRILDSGRILAHLVPAESAAAHRDLVAARQQQLRRDRAALDHLLLLAQHTHHFLENYYLKSKRSVQKPTLEGPAAYVIARRRRRDQSRSRVAQGAQAPARRGPAALRRGHLQTSPGEKRGDKPKPETFPAGSIVVRMDQPYSRIADALLDRQFWAPDDPQKHPYDDTGWSFTHLFNVKAVRIPDPAILKAAMKPVDDPASLAGKLDGAGSHRRRRQLRPDLAAGPRLQAQGREDPSRRKAFDADGKHFAAGSLLITGADDKRRCRAPRSCARRVRISALRPRSPRTPLPRRASPSCTPGSPRRPKAGGATPSTPPACPTTTSARRPSPSRTTCARNTTSSSSPRWAAPSTHDIINGMPMWNNAMPWQKSDLTPNLGRIDSTADMRPGLGYDGLAHLKKFVEQGGLLITCEDTAQFAIDTGLAPGVSVAPHGDARVVGSVLNTVFVAKDNPVAFGYGAKLPVISANGMAFNISNTLGRAAAACLMDPYAERPTGRGSLEDSDEPEGRKAVEAEPLEKRQPGRQRS